MKTEICGIVPGSIAEEIGLAQGDMLVSINGTGPQDIIDYRYLISDEYIDLEIEKQSLERVLFEIEKDPDEDLGIIFPENAFDGMKRCKNKCVFCFVDQMPPSLRSTLYIKDDDYRMSFLSGNFITLTNISEQEMERIKTMHLSPLYVSVHSTNPMLRVKMLNNPRAGCIYEQMKDLAQEGIEMHTQIVLCPGINDGIELDNSIETLKKLWPGVRSVAVVPVGITQFQKNAQLRPFTPDESREIIKNIHCRWKYFQKELGSRFVFLADEFYLQAGENIPGREEYEDFPQIENGVGLVRMFWDSFFQGASRLLAAITFPRKITMVTGVSGKQVLLPIVEKLNRVENLTVELVAIANEFFGSSVTVAGLLTGIDLIKGLSQWRTDQTEELPVVLISSAMLKYGETVFLDGLKVEDVEKNLGIEIIVTEPDGEKLMQILQEEFQDNRIRS